MTHQKNKPAQGGLADMNVLVVDDKSTMRSIIKRMLTSMGIRSVWEAGDGSEALKQIAQRRFDVIIIDWEMPVLNGLETIREIRNSMPLEHSLPVIVMSATPDPKRVQEAADLGVLFYLFKPFSEAVLRERIAVIARLALAEDFITTYNQIGSELAQPLSAPTADAREVVEV